MMNEITRRTILKGAMLMPFGNSRGQGFNNPVANTFRAGFTVINKSGMFVYSGPPAAGNLIYSVAATNGTDAKGNAYLGGGAASYNTLTFQAYLTSGGLVSAWTAASQAGPYTQQGSIQWASGGGWEINTISGDITASLTAALMLAGIPTPSVVAGSSVLYADTSDVMNYISGGDSNRYRMGHFTLEASNVAVTSTVFANALGIPLAAVADGYHITGQALYHSTAAGAGVPAFSWGGGGSGIVLGTQDGYNGFPASGAFHANTGALGQANGPAFGGVAVQGPYVFDIYVTVTTGGTLYITAAESAVGDSWTIDRLYVNVEPY
jgi:hypothetical protein